jgi:hypothetical protein
MAMRPLSTNLNNMVSTDLAAYRCHFRAYFVSILSFLEALGMNAGVIMELMLSQLSVCTFGIRVVNFERSLLCP